MVGLVECFLVWGITKQIRDRYSSEIFGRINELSLLGMALSLLATLLELIGIHSSLSLEWAVFGSLTFGVLHFWGLPWRQLYRFGIPGLYLVIGLLGLFISFRLAGLLIILSLLPFLYMLYKSGGNGIKGVPIIAIGAFAISLILDSIHPSYIYRSWEAIAIIYGLIERLIIYLHSIYLRSVTDRLTGLNNRTTFISYVEDFIQSDHHIGIIFIDIDNFKAVNDTLGHEAGDRVLIDVSRIIKESVLGIGVGGRFGGEEMVALIIDNDPLFVAEEIRKAVQEQTSVTLSLGVAISDQTVSAADLINIADQAMYISKRSGKNQVNLGTKELLN